MHFLEFHAIRLKQILRFKSDLTAKHPKGAKKYNADQSSTTKKAAFSDSLFHFCLYDVNSIRQMPPSGFLRLIRQVFLLYDAVL